MSVISVTNIVDGTTADAADVNNQINTIVNDYNGNIDNSNIAAGAAISGTKLADGTITAAKMTQAATSYTPTFINLTLGNGTLTASYYQVGKKTTVMVNVAFGSTTAVSGQIQFTLPFTSIALPAAADIAVLGEAIFYDGVTSITKGWVAWNSTTKASSFVANASGTYITQTSTSATVPFTWNTGDNFNCIFTYFAA